MLVFFDTSVLVAALVKAHLKHDMASQWLRKAATGEIRMAVSSHTLAELYSVLTTLPVSPRITPEMACLLISENIEKRAAITALSVSDYKAVLQLLRDFGLSGGIVYDALIYKAALKSQAEVLLTLNISDFRRLRPADGIRIAEP